MFHPGNCDVPIRASREGRQKTPGSCSPSIEVFGFWFLTFESSFKFLTTHTHHVTSWFCWVKVSWRGKKAVLVLAHLSSALEGCAYWGPAGPCTAWSCCSRLRWPQCSLWPASWGWLLIVSVCLVMSWSLPPLQYGTWNPFLLVWLNQKDWGKF